VPFALAARADGFECRAAIHFDVLHELNFAARSRQQLLQRRLAIRERPTP
jgi:hypothetical protein